MSGWYSVAVTLIGVSVIMAGLDIYSIKEQNKELNARVTALEQKIARGF